MVYFMSRPALDVKAELMKSVSWLRLLVKWFLTIKMCSENMKIYIYINLNITKMGKLLNLFILHLYFLQDRPVYIITKHKKRIENEEEE